MAIAQPVATDYLDSPDHSLLHRIIAADPAATVESLTVDSTGKTQCSTLGIGTLTGVLKASSGTVAICSNLSDVAYQPAGTYVTAISVASSNGFTGSSSGGATPALTLTASPNGVLKSNGTTMSACANLSDVSYAPLAGAAFTGDCSLTVASTTTTLFAFTGSSLTTGKLLSLYSNSADTSSRSLVSITNDNSAATGATCLTIQQDSTGKAIDCGATGAIKSYSTNRVVVLKAFFDTDTVTTGDGAIYFTCPKELNGMNLVDVGMSIYTTSSSDIPTVTIERGRRSSASGALSYADMLSTAITVDVGEFDSLNAATQPVIDTSNDDIVVSTYVDVLRVNVDIAGTGTKGLEVRLSFQLP